MLTVGLIGCGHIGRFHSRNIRDAIRLFPETFRYDAVCDRQLDRARSFAGIAGCSLATDDAQALIDRSDVVYVCTETAEHPGLVASAAAAGKHVFCEKPLATSSEGARAMLAAVRAGEVLHQVGLVLRFSPVYRVLEHLFGDNDLGALLTAHLRDDQFFPIQGHYDSTWRGEAESSGGGTLIEHSIHDVDLFRRLFGEIETVFCRTRPSPNHPGIEDLALVSFTHTDGASTSLTSVWHNVLSRPSARRLEVFFENGYFATDHDYFGSLTYQLGSSEPVTLTPDEVLERFMRLEELDPAQEDLRSLGGLGDRRFLAAVAGGAPARPDFSDALAAHVVVDACYLSAREACAVNI